MGLIVAHQLNGDHEEAVAVYDGLLSATSVEGATASEQSQLLLSVIKSCIAAGHDDDALRRLERGVVDKVISGRGEIGQIKGE